MFDCTDQFIQCIEDHAPLWDKSLKHYSNRNEREKCWMKIGKIMFINWEDVGEEEKQEKVADMKNKWRHIRDRYLRYINGGKSGGPGNKRKKYVYADALKFLLQTVAGTSGNISDEKIPEYKNAESREERQEAEDESEEIDGEDEGSKSPVITRTKVPKKSKTKHRMTAFQTKLIEKLNSSEKSEEDPDKAFFMSILPEVKKLKDNEKLDFRLHVLQYFRDLRKQHQSPPPQDILPYVFSYYPHQQQLLSLPIPVNEPHYNNLSPTSSCSYTTQDSFIKLETE